MTDEELAAIRERAEKQAAACARMLELNGGVGLLGVREPEMFRDVEAWTDSTDNEHADTVLALVAEVEQLKTELFDKAGPEWAKEYTAARKAEAEVERLRAKLRDHDNELRIRDQEDAESEDMEQRAITAEKRWGHAQAEVALLREERDRLRAALMSADGVIRSVQDALGVEADTDAVIAAKTSAAEVVRLQGIIDQVLAWAEDNDHELTTFSGEVMHTNAGLFAILDGEEQS